MNKMEFLEQLRQALSRNGVRDIDEITVDFLEHFANGVAKGKDEAAIAAELGDPEEIAAQYAAEQPQRAADAAAQAAAVTAGTVGAVPDNGRVPSVRTSGTAATIEANLKPEAGGAAGSAGPANSTGAAYRNVNRPDGGPYYGGRETAAGGSAATNRAPTGAPGYIYAEDSRGNPRTRPAAGYTGVPTGDAAGVPTGAPTGVPNAGQTDQGSATGGYSGGYAASPTGANGYVRSEPDMGTGNRSVNIVLLVLLAIFIAVPVFFSVLGAVIGVWAAAAGVGMGSVGLFVAAITQVGVRTAILVLFGISLATLSALLFIGAFWLTRLFAIGTRAYVRWNRQVAKGGTL